MREKQSHCFSPPIELEVPDAIFDTFLHLDVWANAECFHKVLLIETFVLRIELVDAAPNSDKLCLRQALYAIFLLPDFTFLLPILKVLLLADFGIFVGIKVAKQHFYHRALMFVIELVQERTIFMLSNDTILAAFRHFAGINCIDG